MRPLSLLAMLCLMITLSGCPKKNAGEGEVSSEPVEGASTPASEKSSESSNEEMQEKKGGSTEAAPGDAPAEEKK